MSEKNWNNFHKFVSEKFGVELKTEQIEQFRIYFSELDDCSREFNLTRIISEEDILYRHFADSLACAPGVINAIKKLRKTNLIAADVGSGAGFPGIPVKIAFPDIFVTLVESVKKKCLFIDYVKREIGLTGVEVVCARAEALGENPAYSKSFDMVFNRALTDFEKAGHICRQLAKTGGMIFYWQTEKTCIPHSAGKEREIFNYTLPGTSLTRCIITEMA